MLEAAGEIDAQDAKGVHKMDEKALELRRAYKRQWAKEHKESVRASQERYWQKKAAQMQAEESQEGGRGTP